MPRSTPVTKSLGRPRDVDSAETRRDLLEGARRIFARDGFEATTNRSIAAVVGITSGAIYHYFPSKADLFAAVFDQAQCVVYDGFERAAAGPGTLTERFERVLDAAVEFNRTDPSLAGFLVTVSIEVQRHPELAGLMAPRRSRSAAFVSDLVSTAMANDEFVEGVQPQAVEDIIAIVISGLAIFSTISGDADRHAAAVRALRSFLEGDLVRRRA
jgi:AcrR family transcriptional regulator